MKKFFIISCLVIFSLAVIGAGASYYGFLWAIKQGELKIANQLNAHPNLKVDRVSINLEKKYLKLENLKVTHERIRASFPTVIISTPHDLPYFIQTAKTKKIQNISLHVQIPDFKIDELKLSPKKDFKDVQGHVSFAVALDQKRYQLNIEELAIERLVAGSMNIVIESQDFNLNVSKKIQSDVAKLVKKNVDAWNEIKILEVSGQATNQGLGEMVRGMIQIDQSKLNSLMQTGIQLLSEGKTSDGEKLSKDVLTAAYYFMNSNSEVGFMLKPPKDITTQQILGNLQSKLDLGVMDLGVKLWVKK